ncbi:MAG: DUF547 domain-containing protein [Lewinellaceae bacterium]|nr:DUF547 domain-containing protein [Lewinellaceae bacterium]
MLNMSLVSTLVFFLQISLPAPGEGRQQPIANPPIANPPIHQSTNPPITNHESFDSILQKHVSDAGKVNYKGLKTDKAALDAYCKMLSENPVEESWTKEEKMAYWTNAYNAFTLKLIVDNYPTKSILNFDGGKTWDVRRIKIGDKKYSLNNIENDILRPQFKDPRIHFAINCAAKSCPPLWNHAYTAENLELALENRTRDFVNNSNYNTLSASRAQVSKIFDWYGADFGDLKKFLNQYSETKLNNSTAVVFKEYNWDLNE